MNELIVYVGNCLVSGEKFTEHADGVKIRDRIDLNLNGRMLALRQDREFVLKNGITNHNGSFVAVTSLHFPDVAKEDIPDLLKRSSQLCEFLSYTTESRVVLYGHDFPGKGNVCQRKSVIGTVETSRPPFDILDGSEIRVFIEQCFSRFTQIRETRCLNIVFDYLYHAGKSGLAIEIQLASLFILLENLKHSYAVDVHHPQIKGYFRNLGSTDAAPGPKLTFEFLLNAMFSAVGMNPSMTQIIRLRNELIHSGLIAISPQSKFDLFEEIQDVIREYLLRLLQFSGTYLCYSSGQSKTI